MIRTARRAGAALAWIIAVSALSAGATIPEPGAEGHTLTVIEGRRVERIPVRFLGTYHNFAGPGYDLYLIQLEGPRAEEVGVAAGMSGSPVYFENRLLGALAYRISGGGLPRNPVAGVTPFETMRDATRSEGSAAASVDDRVAPIATPVIVGGATPAVRAWLSEHLEPMGLVAMGGGAAGSATDAEATLPEPGSAVGVELLRGSMRIAATGTVTAVEGDRVFAFGHPFLGSGRVEMPMVSAEVILTLADLAGSTKLANVGEEIGAIVEDRFAAVVGRIGQRASMVPLELSIRGADYDQQDLQFELVRSRRIAPLLSAAALANSLQTNNGYNHESTLILRGEVQLVGGYRLPLEIAAAAGSGEPAFALAADVFRVLSGVWDNRFRELEVERIEMTVDASSEIRAYRLESVHFDRGALRSGEPLVLRCTLRPFRGEPIVRELTLDLPERFETNGMRVIVGNPSSVEAAIGSPLQQRLTSARDAPSFLRALAERRGSHRLTAVAYRPNSGLVVLGQSWDGVPPTARRLLSAQNTVGPPARRGARTLARSDEELDGPVTGWVRLPLRVERVPGEESVR